jgi:ParB-like chromosome segregation protein Spo0J
VTTEWRDRVIAQGREKPDQLLANPWNWRVHPKAQQDALKASLDEIGWVRRVLVNQRTGHVLDGHLRVAIAISKGEPEVPVDYVDLTVEEELVVLASLDPIAGMAVTDREQLEDLLSMAQANTAAMQDVLSNLSTPTDALQFDGKSPGAAQIQQRQDSLEHQFDAADAARTDKMVNLICPDCGHEFSVSQADVLRDGGWRDSGA